MSTNCASRSLTRPIDGALLHRRVAARWRTSTPRVCQSARLAVRPSTFASHSVVCTTSGRSRRISPTSCDELAHSALVECRRMQRCACVAQRVGDVPARLEEGHVEVDSVVPISGRHVCEGVLGTTADRGCRSRRALAWSPRPSQASDELAAASMEVDDPALGVDRDEPGTERQVMVAVGVPIGAEIESVRRRAPRSLPRRGDRPC